MKRSKATEKAMFPWWRGPACRAWLAGLVSMLLLSGCALVSVNLKGPQGICEVSQVGPAENQPVVGKLVHRNTGQVTARRRNVALCQSPDDALKYAAGWRQVFLNAAGQHSAARNSAALIGIPAAAVAGFYGTTGKATADRVGRLSFSAAGVYGTSAFLAPQSKQRAYLEGALALSCLMDRAIPYRVEQSRLDALTKAIADAEARSNTLDTAIQDNRALLPVGSNTLDRAAIVRADAVNLLAKARSMRDAQKNNGLRIGVAVDRIVTQTAQLVSSQESNLNSLLVMANGIRTSAGQLGLSNLPASESASSKPQGKRSGTTKRAAAKASLTARDNIETALKDLRSSLATLSAAMLNLEPPAEADVYGVCQPDLAAAGFSVLPAEPAQTVKVDGTLEFKITNSRSDAFATYALSNNEGGAVVASGPEVKNGKLTITLTGKKTTGTSPVLLNIDDPTGSIRRQYQITVLAKSP